MTKKELCKQYADKKTMDCHNSRFSLSNHDLHVKKSYDLFTGYDIEQAYEDGFDKAVEVACELIEQRLHFEIAGYPVCLPDQFVEDFKGYMEE